MKPLEKHEFDQLREKAAEFLGTATTPAVISGEALLGIEGLARCAAGPGRTFVNLVTGPDGKEFGVWLRECGSKVVDIETPYDEVVTLKAVREALDAVRPDGLSYVYAEAVTGGANPVKEIQEIAREYGVYTILDAVSSIGADPFLMDEWGVDFVSMGLQKALMGSNGISFLGISERGMQWLRENPVAPRHSLLSTPEVFDLQQKEIPSYLSVLEVREALRAFEEIEASGGIRALEEKHQKLAVFVRDQVREMGYQLYQKREANCSALNTTVRLPATEAARQFERAGIVACGDFDLKGQLLRINHYGEHCKEEDVKEALEILRGLL